MNPKEDDMKKLLVVLMVLSVATIANAGLVITGVPTDPIKPSDNLIIGVSGDGQEALAFAAYVVVQGPAMLAGGTLNYSFGLSEYGLHTNDDTYVPWMQGIYNDPSIQQVAHIFFADTTVPVTPLNGALVSNIAFHCEGPGDVTISLVTMNDDGSAVLTIWDTQIVHQIPEPMTLGLLGIGGLFLRRRK